MTIVLPASYYDRTDTTLNYKKLLCISGLGVQSAEFNEWQDNAHYEMQTVLDTIYPDGTILTGGVITASGAPYGWIISASLFWAQGYTFHVPAYSYTIGADETVIVGIYLTSTVINANTDPTLRDPAINTRNFNQPGANRLKITPAWCKQPDLPAGADFYPIVTYVNGVQVSPVINPGGPDSEWYRELAHYDYVAHDSYVIYGLNTTWISDDSGSHTSLLNVSAGQAHVLGYEFTWPFDQRLTMPWCMGTDTVLQEPATYVLGQTLYSPRDTNIASVSNCHGISQVEPTDANSTIVHGTFTGCSDLLPDSPVTTILYVNMGGTWDHGTQLFAGGTNYYITSDWIQSGNYINWSPAGSEPAPGDTYYIVYQYSKSVTATVNSSTQISVPTLLAGSVFYFDYTYYLPRIDAVVMGLDGRLLIIPGTANSKTPQPPVPLPATRAPQYWHGNVLTLANLQNVYGLSPVINNDSYKAVPFYSIMKMQDQIATNEANIATLSLNSTLNAADPTSTKLGIFVDPMTSEVERDQGYTGVSQNAHSSSIGMLPEIVFTDYSLSTGAPYTLPFTVSPYFTQGSVTSTRLINAYVSAHVPPAHMTVVPGTFSYISQIIRITQWDWWWCWGYWWWWWWGGWASIGYPTRTYEKVSNIATTVPQNNIHLYSYYFNGGESVTVQYDGGVVTNTLTADGSGFISAVVTTPVGLLSGTHLITLTGLSSGVIGAAVYTAVPIIETIIRTYWCWWFWDPLAETFTIQEKIYIPSIDLWFTHNTTSFVDVQIVKTIAGIPDKTTVYASARLLPTDICVNTSGGVFTTPPATPYPEDVDRNTFVWFGAPHYYSVKSTTNWTHVVFKEPFSPEIGVEYAIVLQTGDASAIVGTAVLGQFDTVHAKWVTSNVDPSGTMLISSNATSWLPILGETLTFRINYCTFTSTPAYAFPTIVSVTNATDLMLLAGIDTPVGTTASFTATLMDRGSQVYPIIPNQALVISMGSPNDVYTGRVLITMILTTTNAKVTPQVSGNITLSVGTLTAVSNWIDRLVVVPATAVNIKLYIKMYESSNGQIVVYYLDADGVTWHAMTRNAGGAIQIGNGWANMPFYANSVAAALITPGTRFKVTQTCTDKSLRCMASDLICYFT